MPDTNCKFLTNEIMREMRSGECYCPKENTFTFASCVKKPKKEVLKSIVFGCIDNLVQTMSAREAAPYLRLKELLQSPKRDVNKDYLVILIADLSKGKHEIFNKGYLPPKE